MSDIIDDNKLNEADIEYVIISKDKSDILNELDFENEEEKLLCDSIITNLEKMASENIRNMKVVQLPYIGCIRINPVKREFRDSKKHLGIIRKSLSKEQYKEHVRSYIVDLQEKQKVKDRVKLVLHRIRRKNKVRYEKLYKKLGKSYADLFIMSIYWLREVPFDKEWQERYDELSNINRDELMRKELEESANIDKKDIENFVHSQKRYSFR